MRHRAAQFFLRDHFVGDGLDHIGAGHEHEAAILHHEDEVRHRRRIDRAARARSHDDADLRDHARRQHVALENLCIAAKRCHALLDARATAVVQADHGRADLHRHIHDLANFHRVPFRHRAAIDGEILAEEEDQTPVYGARAGNDAVARHMRFIHAEIDAIMFDIHVDLFKTAFIQQYFDPLPRGQLALGVLRVDAALTAAQPSGVALGFQLFNDGELRHGGHLSESGSDRLASLLDSAAASSQMRICQFANHDFAN